MKSYLITDGYSIAKEKDKVFGFLEENENCTLFVNGMEYVANNAKQISDCILNKSPLSDLELGFVLGIVKKESELSSSYNLRKPYGEKECCSKVFVSSFSMEKKDEESFSFLKTLPFELSFASLSEKKNCEIDEFKSQINVGESQNSMEIEAIDKSSKEPSVTNTESESPSPFRKLEEPPKKRRTRKAKEVAVKEEEGVFETDLLNSKQEKEENNKAVEEEQKEPSVVVNEPKLEEDSDLGEESSLLSGPLPCTLEELKSYPLKKGRSFSAEGRTVIEHMINNCGFTLAEIAKVLNTYPSILRRNLYGQDKQGIQKEEANEIQSDVNPSLIEIPGVPQAMKAQMEYDLHRFQKLAVDGILLSGNIIRDCEEAIGVSFSDKDKKTLVNAFFCLKIYEEDFIRNLTMESFSHIDKVERLKNICNFYLKVRKAKALGINVNEE